MKKIVKIIGGGLAGCECAYQLAKRGIEVKLYDMKPKFTPAHHNPNLAELVCSNSLKSDDILTAGGLLKQEMRELFAFVREKKPSLFEDFYEFNINKMEG